MEVGTLAVPKVPSEMRDQFLQLFTPANIGLMIAFVVLVAAAHLSPLAIVAMIADGLTVLLGAVLIGSAIFTVAHDVATFVDKTFRATTYHDLETAADSLARVVATIGVTVLMVLIAKTAGRAVRVAASEAVTADSAPRAKPGPKLYEMINVENKSNTVMGEAFRNAAVKEQIIERNPEFGRSRFRDASGELKRSSVEIDNRMAGHAMTKGMGQKVLPAGTEIIQYVRANGKLGTFCAYPGTKASQLGIIGKNRITLRIVIEKPITVWESTAADFDARRGISGVGGKGGGTQLWLPDNWLNSARLIWGELPEVKVGGGIVKSANSQK